MNTNVRYATILAASLLLCSVAGEAMSDPPRFLLRFYWFSYPCFPAVLYVLLRRTRTAEGTLSFRRGLHLGEAVVRHAAFVLAPVASAIEFLRASYFSPTGTYWVDSWSVTAAAVAFTGTLLCTWIVGVAFSALCAWIVSRQAPARSGALPAA